MTLTFSDVLAESVEAEATAATFYARIQAHAEGPEARALLVAMEAIQRAHCEQIAAEGRALLNSRLPVAPHTGTTRAHLAPGWDDLEDLSLDEALQIALECQNRAVEYYTGLASMFDGAEEAMLRRAADVERGFVRQLQGAVARRAHERRRARTLAQIISSVVVARRSAARALGRLGSRSADAQTERFVQKVVAYEEQRSAEIAALSPLDGSPEPRSPAFAISVPDKGVGPLDLEAAMRLAMELEEKTASYCTRGAATLRGVEAKVLRNLAVQCLDYAETIAAVLGQVTGTAGEQPGRSSDPRLAA